MSRAPQHPASWPPLSTLPHFGTPSQSLMMGYSACLAPSSRYGDGLRPLDCRLQRRSWIVVWVILPPPQRGRCAFHIVGRWLLPALTVNTLTGLFDKSYSISFFFFSFSISHLWFYFVSCVCLCILPPPAPQLTLVLWNLTARTLLCFQILCRLSRYAREI